MKSLFLKALMALISVLFAFAIWLGLVTILTKVDISFIKVFTIYISQFGFGWLLIGLMSIFFYSIFLKYMKKQEK